MNICVQIHFYGFVRNQINECNTNEIHDSNSHYNINNTLFSIWFSRKVVHMFRHTYIFCYLLLSIETTFNQFKSTSKARRKKVALISHLAYNPMVLESAIMKMCEKWSREWLFDY